MPERPNPVEDHGESKGKESKLHLLTTYNLESSLGKFPKEFVETCALLSSQKKPEYPGDLDIAREGLEKWADYFRDLSDAIREQLAQFKPTVQGFEEKRDQS